MSDPTNPADPHDQGADTTELPAVPPANTNPGKAAGTSADATKPGGTTPDSTRTDVTKADDTKADITDADATKPGSAKADAAKADGGKGGQKRRFGVRGPWVTVGGVVVVLAALAVVGYVWGLGPLSRLNAERAITPPAQVAGLDRITDPEIRSQAQLDQTRDALSRINDGKKVMVEAYGSLEGDRFYVLIALRGRVDIDKVVADSGASPDKVKKINNTTCIEAAGNLPTQCYRGSNTLTVIAQSANEGVGVDQVEPVAEEAFRAMH
ncbi:hypothetical protein [Kribbella sp. NPDC048915]|uniref:hypothetical protein n=1 Tax=Kribbella sp. NPDC048915 TaxID=3155148 RepID=UPI0033E99DC7